MPDLDNVDDDDNEDNGHFGALMGGDAADVDDDDDDDEVEADFAVPTVLRRTPSQDPSLAAPPRPRPPPLRPRPDDELLDPPRRPSRARAPRTEHAERVSDEYSDLIAGLDFGPDQHKVIITRLEPEFDPETGKKLSGVLGTFQRKFTVEDIQHRFGGGIYKVTVRGPREDTGRGSVIKMHTTIDIAGEPRALPDPRQEERERREKESSANGLIAHVMETQEKMMEKAQREAERTQQTIFSLVKEIATAKPDNTSSNAALEAIRLDIERKDREAKEQRERDDLRRREEKEERDRRDSVEREERKAREAEQSRQHDLHMEKMRQDFALQLENAKQSQIAVAAQAKADASMQQKNTEMMITLMTRTDAEKETRTQAQMQMQMQMQQSFQQMQMDMTRQMGETQMRVVTEQLKEARSKDNFFEAFEKFQLFKEMIDGKDERTGFERAADKLTEIAGEVAPYVMGQFTARQQAQGQAAHPPSPAAGPRPLAPGTVAVVDDIDATIAAQRGISPPEQARPALPARAGASRVAEEEEVPEVEDFPNDLIEFLDDIPDGSNDEMLEVLVKSIDLGMQRGMSFDEIYNQVITKIPATKQQLLCVLEADVIVNHVDVTYPEVWPIRSFGGQQMMRDLHARLKALSS